MLISLFNANDLIDCGGTLANEIHARLLIGGCL